ncbi:MAG TPA: hypothetical protein VK866_13350 [Acidimicrobiales bacterium]|nr:hypothetical protein [Acidimicrobiales bacterium]
MLTRVITPHRIAYVVLLAVAVAGIVIAVNNGRPNPNQVSDANPAIDALVPTPGSEVLRQAQIGIDLAAGYTAELTVNGVPIPAEQILGGDASLAQFFYLPREGNAVEQLNPGPNCITAVYWAIAEGRESASAERWCFEVL